MLVEDAEKERDRLNSLDCGDWFCPLLNRTCRSNCISFIPRIIYNYDHPKTDGFAVTKSSCTYFVRQGS